MRTLETISKPTEMNIPPGLKGLDVVSISSGKRNYGLYQVKWADGSSLLLHPGAYSPPVGTQVDIEDYQYRTPNHDSFHQRATVVESNRNGLRMIW
jgi:hypothetical protein